MVRDPRLGKRSFKTMQVELTLNILRLVPRCVRFFFSLAVKKFLVRWSRDTEESVLPRSLFLILTRIEVRDEHC